MNKATRKVVLIATVIIFAGVFYRAAKNSLRGNIPPPSTVNTPANSSSSSGKQSPSQDTGTTAPPENTNIAAPQSPDGFEPPLDRASERVTKKPFGIYITPQTSPIQPERFQGYHTGTDFEVFPEELNADVSVHAICDGKISLKKSASGYGGVLVEGCTLNNQPVTIIYGHLKLASISKNTNDELSAGETIGILGKSYSSETDGERKHLHLGIHKGSRINILGYVSSQSQLSGWIDACTLVCK